MRLGLGGYEFVVVNDYYVKDEGTGDRPYFVYQHRPDGSSNSTNLRYNNKAKAHKVANFLNKMEAK